MKLLYLTTTDWFWPKQRPQFLAEELTSFYDVTYVFHKTYKTNNISPGRAVTLSRLKIMSLFRLPLNRFSLFRSLNKILTIIQLVRNLRSSDIIWFSNPDIFGMVRSIIPVNKIVVYDCIDDHTEFDIVRNNKKRLKEVVKTEKDLIERSDLVIVSSDNLKMKLMKRYNIAKEITVINNAISPAIFSYKSDSLNKVFEKENLGNYFKLVYTGTISEWFDFDILVKSLKRFENIAYILIGPAECKIPVEKRIIHIGPVPHENMLSAFINGDALIMPFKSNELVYSVNPVKIYEYIFSGKPSLIPEYPETEKFGDFVFLYKSDSEYFALIEKLVNKQLIIKTGKESIMQFIKENTWEIRGQTINRIISGSLSENASK